MASVPELPAWRSIRVVVLSVIASTQLVVANDDPIHVGDTVIVTAKTARIVAGKSTVAEVPQGRRLTVTGVEGEWIEVEMGPEGKAVKGRVKASSVMRLQESKKPGGTLPGTKSSTQEKDTMRTRKANTRPQTAAPKVSGPGRSSGWSQPFMMLVPEKLPLQVTEFEIGRDNIARYRLSRVKDIDLNANPEHIYALVIYSLSAEERRIQTLASARGPQTVEIKNGKIRAALTVLEGGEYVGARWWAPIATMSSEARNSVRKEGVGTETLKRMRELQRETALKALDQGPSTDFFISLEPMSGVPSLSIPSQGEVRGLGVYSIVLVETDSNFNPTTQLSAFLRAKEKK